MSLTSFQFCMTQEKWPIQISSARHERDMFGVEFSLLFQLSLRALIHIARYSAVEQNNAENRHFLNIKEITSLRIMQSLLQLLFQFLRLPKLSPFSSPLTLPLFPEVLKSSCKTYPTISPLTLLRAEADPYNKTKAFPQPLQTMARRKKDSLNQQLQAWNADNFNYLQVDDYLSRQTSFFFFSMYTHS